MGVPTDPMALELLGKLILLRAYLASTDEMPLPVGPGNVVNALAKDASSTYGTRATMDISSVLVAILLFAHAQSQCLSLFRGIIAQTTPRALPSALTLSGPSPLPVRRGVALESFIYAYQLRLLLLQLSLLFAVSTTVPGFRHLTTCALPCGANGTFVVPYDTEDVDEVIPRASPIFGRDTSPLFQMGIVVWLKLWYETLRSLRVNLNAGVRTNGMMKENGILQGHSAVMLGHCLPADVRQCAGGSPSQPKSSGNVESSGQQQTWHQGRKRPYPSGDDEQPESNSQRSPDNGSNDKVRAVNDDEYYCPYYLKDRIRHEACWKKKWRGNDLRKLKEHLEKKHLRWVCNFCHQAFVDRSSRDRHTHLENGQRDYVDGFNHEQKAELGDRSKIWRRGGEEYYNIICKILFPDDEPLSAHRVFTWEEMQDIRQRYDKLQQEHNELKHEHNKLEHEYNELKQQRDELLTSSVESNLMFNPDLNQIDYDLNQINYDLNQINYDLNQIDYDQNQLENDQNRLENDQNQLDNLVSSTQGGGAAPMNDDRQETNAGTDDIDLLAATQAQQQDSDSEAGTRSQRLDFLSNDFQYRKEPPIDSVNEKASSSSLPLQSSQSSWSQNHDPGESSSFSSVPEIVRMKYTDKPDSDGASRSNSYGADNARSTNRARFGRQPGS